MPELMYREALNHALREEMERDANVFLMGEEVGRYQGAFKVSQGLLESFGSARVVDAPISELGFTGLGVGAAMVATSPPDGYTFLLAPTAILAITPGQRQVPYNVEDLVAVCRLAATEDLAYPFQRLD